MISLPAWDVEGEDTFVEYGAYLMALKGSAASCEDYIKDYVGPYGPRWKFKWYRSVVRVSYLSRENEPVPRKRKILILWFRVPEGPLLRYC